MHSLIQPGSRGKTSLTVNWTRIGDSTEWRMLRNLGIAAMLSLAVVMPVHEAAAQDALGGAILGGGVGALFGGALGADVTVRQSARSSGWGRGLPLPLRVNGAGEADRRRQHPSFQRERSVCRATETLSPEYLPWNTNPSENPRR
jgi:hypothetical protein